MRSAASGSAPGCFFDGRRFELGYAFDLCGVENGIVFKDANNLFVLIFRWLRSARLVLLRERDRGRLFALLNVPALLMRLLESAETRIAAHEGKGVHSRDEDIESVIALAGDGIEWGLRPCALRRSNPGLYAFLELAYGPIGKLLHRVTTFGNFAFGIYFPRPPLLRENNRQGSTDEQEHRY